jgi:nitroimidazol reductase NimA-like FMN-containing flavoprotein (pyridoxamine 5'-phosphate oxidase superfamily)
MNFAYADKKLYFHSAREGRKLDLIRHNPRVGFALAIETAVAVTGDGPCGWTMRYRSVVGRGRAVIVEDGLEKIGALDLIMAHYGGPTDGYDPRRVAAIAVIRVDIETMAGKRSA